MALNFDALPEEAQVPNALPSLALWTVVFLILLLVGVFIVLMLWPSGEPTRTPWFWICVTVYPAGIAGFFVSRVFSVYDGQRLDALAWNKARTQFVEAEFARESVPLRILGATFRASEIDDDNRVQSIVDRTVTLDAKPSVHATDASVTARWLEPIDACLAADDVERHEQVLNWLYDKLLTDLAVPLRALPAEVKLDVLLDVSGYLGDADFTKLWLARWHHHEMRDAHLHATTEKLELMAVDAWLDAEPNALAVDRSVVLLVSISLSEVLKQDPAHGSAECGVGILMTSASVSTRHALSPVASLHRPLRSDCNDLNHALTYALKWGSVAAGSLEVAWLTGFDAQSIGPLHAAIGAIGTHAMPNEPLPECDLDSTIGHAGPTAGWLAVACASLGVASSGTPHLIAQHCDDQTFVAVVTTGDHESRNKEISA